MAQIKAKERD
jgi:hypothetical protein